MQSKAACHGFRSRNSNVVLKRAGDHTGERSSRDRGAHGDKVLFVRRDDGSISLFGQNMMAMRVAMGAFEGAAEEAGIQGEDDIATLVREARADMCAEVARTSS